MRSDGWSSNWRIQMIGFMMQVDCLDVIACTSYFLVNCGKVRSKGCHLLHRSRGFDYRLPEDLTVIS